MTKSVKWLIVWGALLHAGALVSAGYQIAHILKTGGPPAYPPYPAFIMLVLFGYLPFLVIPAVTASHIYAVKENVKPIRILSPIFLFQHLLVLILAIFEHLGSVL